MNQSDALPADWGTHEPQQASRVQLAHRSHGAAVEHVQRLALSLDTAFARLEIARERLDAEGVTASVQLPDWLRQAFTHWRTARAATENERRVTAAVQAAGRPLEHIPSGPMRLDGLGGNLYLPDPRD